MTRGEARTRAAWGVADQGLSSATNFALSVLVARSVDTKAFGTFALVFATYLMALGVSRSVNTQPLVVRFTTVPVDEWRRGTKQATGAALVLGGIVGVGAVIVGAVVGGAVGASILALGVVMPGLLLQDAWRHAFFAAGRGRSAFVNDLVWTIAMVPALVLAMRIDDPTAVPFVLAWGTSAGVAALVGIVQSRAFPAPLAVVRWQRAQRDLAPRFLGEFVTLSASNQLLVYSVAGIAGLTAVGTIRAGQVLLGPLNILQQGAWLVAMPEQVRLLQKGSRRFTRLSASISVALCLAALAYGGLVLLLPDSVGTQLFGQTWFNATTVIVPLMIADAALGLWIGAVLGVRAMAAAKRSFRTRLITSPLTLGAGALGAAIGGAEGAAWGVATATLIGVPLWWITFRRALAERRADGASATDGEAPPESASKALVP